MTRQYNFSAGPATLPLEVLERAQEEMLDWGGKGMSVMEMSHRGKEFLSIAERAESDLRELLQIPANYEVLFLQGGASSQFAMVPLNSARRKSARPITSIPGSGRKRPLPKRSASVMSMSRPRLRTPGLPPSLRADTWQLDDPGGLCPLYPQ